MKQFIFSRKDCFSSYLPHYLSISVQNRQEKYAKEKWKKDKMETINKI